MINYQPFQIVLTLTILSIS